MQVTPYLGEVERTGLHAEISSVDKSARRRYPIHQGRLLPTFIRACTPCHPRMAALRFSDHINGGFMTEVTEKDHPEMTTGPDELNRQLSLWYQRLVFVLGIAAMAH
jgi:hypothetical protein